MAANGINAGLDMQYPLEIDKLASPSTSVSLARDNQADIFVLYIIKMMLSLGDKMCVSLECCLKNKETVNPITY